MINLAPGLEQGEKNFYWSIIQEYFASTWENRAPILYLS